MLRALIERRLRELELSPATFVFNRIGGENITRTYDYLRGFDEDLEMHPMPEPTCRSLVQALEVPYEQVRAAASNSYKRLSEGWVGFIPHAETVLHPYDGPPIRGFGAMILDLDTRIDFVPGSHPDSFIRQAVERWGRRRRHPRVRRFHSIIINYAPGMAVRVNSAGTEIERLGDEERN